jgi:hypothetical protein
VLYEKADDCRRGQSVCICRAWPWVTREIPAVRHRDDVVLKQIADQKTACPSDEPGSSRLRPV